MIEAEQAVATYLTLDGHVFIAPQYNIAYDKTLDEGGCVPDFVAIDLKLREIVIVEVSVAADMKPLIRRIEKRQTRWYGPVERRLKKIFAVDGDWKSPRFIGFVRAANVALMQKRFFGDGDVAFKAIEETSHSWNYWDERLANGLPR